MHRAKGSLATGRGWHGAAHHRSGANGPERIALLVNGRANGKPVFSGKAISNRLLILANSLLILKPRVHIWHDHEVKIIAVWQIRRHMVDRVQPKDLVDIRKAIMTENVILAVEFAVIPARFEDFKSLMAAMIDATQNEFGTLNYEWAISDDRQICHVYERFQDSAAVMTHLERFNANFAARFSETVKLARFVVYGTPSPQVKDALAGANPVYMAPFGGFKR